ncbi:MAG: hypothetical protein WBA63_08860 [Thermomicrobiales bacterium]
MFTNLDRYQRNLYGGFLAGLTMGILFAMLVPQIWWLGIIGGALFGLLVGRIFANDAKWDMENQAQRERLSRRSHPQVDAPVRPPHVPSSPHS